MGTRVANFQLFEHDNSRAMYTIDASALNFGDYDHKVKVRGQFFSENLMCSRTCTSWGSRPPKDSAARRLKGSTDGWQYLIFFPRWSYACFWCWPSNALLECTTRGSYAQPVWDPHPSQPTQWKQLPRASRAVNIYSAVLTLWHTKARLVIRSQAGSNYICYI